MKLKENIKAILESNFSESKDEIKEIATESIIATVKASFVIDEKTCIHGEWRDDIKEIVKERATLPYDAMGDYSNAPYSTGKLSPDEWYRENFGEYDKVKG